MQRLEKKRIHDAEDRSVRANAQHQGDDGHGGESGLLSNIRAP
jgi:hypothetical protein